MTQEDIAMILTPRALVSLRRVQDTNELTLAGYNIPGELVTSVFGQNTTHQMDARWHKEEANYALPKRLGKRLK
jgi:hypothetical protein